MGAILARTHPANKRSRGTPRLRRVPLAWLATPRAAAQPGDSVSCCNFCLRRLVRVCTVAVLGALN